MRNYILFGAVLCAAFFCTCDSDTQLSFSEPTVQAACEQMDTRFWFGGDNRSGMDEDGNDFFPRNVFYGQQVTLDSTIRATQFSIHLSGPFQFAEGPSTFNRDYNIRLNVRDEQGLILTQITRLLPPEFPGGWVDFNLDFLNLTLEKDVTYIFTWHTRNGEDLAANSFVTASQGMLEESICGGGALFAETQEANGADDNAFSNYTAAPAGVNFNFRLVGEVLR